MAYKKTDVDVEIDRWHQDFEQVQQSWEEWCRRNAAKYDTASDAWGAFIKIHQQRCLQEGLRPR